MKPLVVKKILNFGDFLGRTFLYNQNPPYFINVHRDIIYSDIDPVSNRLDVFSPVDITTDFPVLMFVHGGGWIAGDKKSYDKYCRLIASSGFVVISINYRLSPENIFPDQIEDVLNAISFVKNNMAKFHKNNKIDHIFLAGDSAGAHLASLASTIITNPKLGKHYAEHFKIPKIKILGVCLYYGVYDFNTVVFSGFHDIKTMVSSFFGSSKPSNNPFYLYASPYYFVTPDFPPTFITSGEVDPLCDQSKNFILALKSQNIKVDSLIYDKTKKDAGHSFLHFYRRKSTQTSFIRMIKFITIEYALYQINEEMDCKKNNA